MREQTRSDRDDYVTIKWTNINSDFVSNFQKNPSMTDFYGFGYDSIMHYPKWAFSKNGQDTIVPVRSWPGGGHGRHRRRAGRSGGRERGAPSGRRCHWCRRPRGMALLHPCRRGHCSVRSTAAGQLHARARVPQPIYSNTGGVTMLSS